MSRRWQIIHDKLGKYKRYMVIRFAVYALDIRWYEDSRFCEW